MASAEPTPGCTTKVQLKADAMLLPGAKIGGEVTMGSNGAKTAFAFVVPES